MKSPQLPSLRTLRAVLVSIAAAAVCIAQTGEKSRSEKSFDIPAQPAARALRIFATQAGVEVVFGTSATNSVRSRELKGSYQPSEAIRRLLDGTGLSAVQDEKTGAFTVSRDPEPPKSAPRGADRPDRVVPATSPANASSANERGEETITLTAFEVTSTMGRGYTSSNAATGFKTNEVLLKIPQAVSVVTRDFMDDIGSVQTTDIMAFIGVGNFFRGDSFSIRGTRIAYALVDEMPENGYVDNVFVDSITVIRGPAATLYMNASLGGLILKTSKAPLPVARQSARFKVDDTGFYRGEIDSTGPIGSLGDVKFYYRLVGAYQGGDSYFKNSIDHRKAIHPTLDLVWNKTKVRFALEYQDVLLTPNANNIVTPTGELYTGAGRDEAYFAPGTMQTTLRRNIKMFVFQKLADEWDLKLSANRLAVRTLAGIAFPSGGVNWPAQTMTFTARRNNSIADYDSILLDVNGRYKLGSFSQQSTLGLSYDREISEGRFWGSAAFGRVTVPINNPQMDLMHVPRAEDYVAPANPGGIGTTYRGNAYFQQVMDLIPERLSLVGGVTYSKVKSNNVANSVTRPPATTTEGSDIIHRYGITYNITKDLIAYAMESTTFAPQSNRDINLNVLPVVVGTGREVGLKTAFFEGRLSSTLAVFDMKLTNQSFFAGVRPDGISYFAPIGTTSQKGFDMDVTYSTGKGTQLIATAFRGKVRDQANNPVPNSTRQTISFFGRHAFQDGPLRGFTIGGGYSRISGRTVSTSNYVTGLSPQPPLIYLKPGNNVSAFVAYQFNRNLSARANVENVLDEAYASGAQTAYFVDPSPPRTVSLTVDYRF